MQSFVQKNHRTIFYSLWLLLGLIQAGSSQLIDDEAYYWVYSKFLAWGYYDHPPAIALMIKWGYALFHNELGVRFFSVLLSTGTLMITEKLTQKKNPWLFYAIAISMAALQIAGILAVPDTPLLFFTALFFYAYKKFKESASAKHIVFLALVMAALMYSKYHGALVIIFTILSDIKLLTNYRFYIAGILAMVIFAPHLLWQWQNDFPSFRYHLSERNDNPYQFSFTTDYILGQLLVAGPFIGLLLIPAAILFKTTSPAERAMKFTLIGFYVFFFINSFRNRVEPNWTFPVLISLIVLGHQFLIDKTKWVKWIKPILVTTILLVTIVRIYIMMDIGPNNNLKGRFHGTKEWVAVLKEKTNASPMVFYNSYQKASQYWFYTGIPSHSLSTYEGRRNNYNFWPVDEWLFNKPVFLGVTDKKEPGVQEIIKSVHYIYYRYDSSFTALGKIKLLPEKNEYKIKKGEAFTIRFTREISVADSIYLKTHSSDETELVACIFNLKENTANLPAGFTAQQLSEPKEFETTLSTGQLPPGKYAIRFAIKSKKYPLLNNSDKIMLQVADQ